MDRFRTRVDIPEPAVKISYHTKSVFMGSCFADRMGRIMADYKFPVLLNPFGTLFNPLSIGDNVLRLISGREFTPEEIHYYNDLWISFSHYTGFAHPHRETCLTHINSSFLPASKELKTADFLLLTFGTAFTYQLKETGKTVANCHKLPASSFTRRLADPGEIIGHYDALLQDIRRFNPALKVIFTLSPVRHWSDGAENNQLSKSILHYSIHEIMRRNSGTYYFPAYEIYMDELRDYRFYAADMLHPSEQGIQYVWERFSDTWLDDSSKKIMAGVTAVLKAAGHRPLHTESTNHKKFIQHTRKQIEHLTGLYPFLDFSNEIALLQLDNE
jgi:hypothetical protein